MTINLREVDANIRSGLIDSRIFHDAETYELELDRVFRRSWLFLGHTSMIPNAGDYITSFMGEDPVIVVRDKAGDVRVFLNRCSHRGVQLCPYDRGNAKSFVCPYHGWTYGTDGALNQVPERESFTAEFDPTKLGLIAIPRVETYGGFIFATQDAGAIGLDDFLGDMRYYIDTIFGRAGGGGIEVSPIKQRVTSSYNWKIAADNNSDMYHVGITHAGAWDILTPFADFMPETGFGDSLHLITTEDGGKPAHSLLRAKALLDAEAYDIAIARTIDEESVDYIKRRYRQIAEGDARIAPGFFTIAAMFPSLLFVDIGPLTMGVTIEVQHPKGPRKTETWLYILVEKDMPPALKKFAVQQQMRFHSFSGSVVGDDHENWERMDAGSGAPTARTLPMRYVLGNEAGAPPAYHAAGFNDLPGTVQFGMSEAGGRAMYRHWSRLMQDA